MTRLESQGSEERLLPSPCISNSGVGEMGTRKEHNQKYLDHMTILKSMSGSLGSLQ